MAALDPVALVPSGNELNPAWLVISEDPEAEMAELCYIPTLGGGFGYSWSEVERWPVSRKHRMLEWLKSRREHEAKALAGKGGSGGGGARDVTQFSPPRGPSLSSPGPP